GAESPSGDAEAGDPTGDAAEGSFAADGAASDGTARPEMNARAKQAYRAALRAFAAGDLAGARRQLQAAIEADADAYQAHYSLGVVEERLRERSKAAASYRKALQLVPDDEQAASALALLWAREGQHERAVADLRA